ncbi:MULTISPECIES: DUF2768 family protein [Brevibacillus]|nr:MULTISPECIES: DUF2768 family protein [Brevibacillus]
MNISFVAIALMFVCNFMMLFSRKTQNAWLRFVLRTVGFLMLLVIFVLILVVMFV